MRNLFHSIARRVSAFLAGPAGAKEVFIVALPLIISSLSWTVMTFVDRMMLRWVSGDAMSAAFQGNVVWFSFLCLPLGICSYANTFVSQYHGDGQFQKIGSSVWQAIWLAALFIPLIALGVPLAPVIFAWAGHGPTIAPMETIYFQTLCWGSGGMLISQSASAFFSGRGQTKVVMWVDCFFALVNLGLDYVWIFGYYGFPEMGIAGAGYATAVSLWLKALTYLALMLRKTHREKFGTANWRWDRSLFGRMMKFGVPSGLQMFLDVVGFTIFILLLARLGSVEAEASSMAFSISSFSFMPIWGLGLTAGILVGQRLGENRADLAARSAWTSLIIGWGYMFLISLFYWFVPELFLSGFFAATTADGSTAGAADSRQLAATLLQFVAAYNLFDATMMIMANAIKGAGDTRFVMWVSLLMATCLAAISYLVVEKFQWGIYACWGLITGWVCLLGIVFLCRFVGGKWKTMRVIEMQHGTVE